MNPQNTFSPGLISVDQFKQDDLAQPPQAMQPQAPQQPQAPSGNWFTHLLPTIGGIGGSILGGVATLGLGGEVAGGAGGAALGKTLENAMEGKNPLQSNDLTAGVEGGLGSLAGGVAGRFLGKAGEALGNRATNIENAATQEAAAANEAQGKIDTAIANKNNFPGLSPKIQSGNQLALGSNQKLLDDLGYDSTDPYQMQQASLAGNDPADANTLSLNKVYDQALQNAKPVDMSDFGNNVFKTMQNTGTTDLSTSPLGKALADFNNKTEGLYGNDTGVELPNNMSATDVRKLQQAIGREVGHQQNIINAADNLGQPNVQAETHLSTLSSLYNDLGSKIKTPEVDAAVAQRVTTPAERDALVAKFGDTHGNQIADTIDNAKSAQDLIDPMKNYTQMGKASDIAIDNLENVTAGPANVARTKAEVNPSEPVEAQVPGVTDAVPHIVNNSHGGLLNTAMQTGKHVINNPGILNTLSRIGNLGEKLATPTGVALATAPNLGAAPVAAVQQPANGIMGATMQQPGQSPLDQLYSTLLANYQASGGVTPNDAAIAQTLGGLAPQVQHNNMVATSLAGLPGLYANAGGAQGLGGILSNISALVPGTAANRYHSAVNAEAPQLQQLGVNPALLPTLMSNGQTAGLSQGILNQMQGQLAY